jgi:glyoxylase-like metal-dependent hydrolase (beta-lactamase superfamily II)
VRALGLHADVIVAVSRAYQTACTLVRCDGEAFCIDSPVFPDELEILPALAEQAGFGVVGLLATHADWDHLLGRYAFPEAPLGLAETSSARLAGNPGVAQRELRAFDEELYVERPSPLSLPGAQSLPVPGHCGLGEAELELQPADGHTADGMAIWIPWARVLVCGDYLSPLEIPMISPEGSASAYLATLRRLEPLVEQAEHVVPGHGGPIEGVRAAAILREDVGYLEDLLEVGEKAKLPLARRTGAQRKVHADNAERVHASTS